MAFPPSPYLPEAHSEHDKEPAIEYLPEPHVLEHADETKVFPGAPHVPAGQFKQAEATTEYFPSTHRSHAVLAVLPTGEDFPAGHEPEQAELVNTALGAPQVPAGQSTQAEAMPETIVEYLPSKQRVQDDAPLVEEYPASQDVHDAAFPSAALKVPASQSTQPFVAEDAPVTAFLPAGQVNDPAQED